jgi:predicted nucleic acid-binding Zn ribbon protein
MTRACAECCATFTTTRSLQKFCSRKCMIRENRRRQKARRRARQAGLAYEHIDLATLAERDGWRCHICKRQVTRDTWSLDHLVPVADGGAHVYANAALAHRACNAARGHRGAAQLRLDAANLDHTVRVIKHRACVVCAAQFAPISPRHQTCSATCRAERKRRKASEAYHALDLAAKQERAGGLKPRTAATCAACGTEFTTLRANYCSSACRLWSWRNPHKARPCAV